MTKLKNFFKSRLDDVFWHLSGEISFEMEIKWSRMDQNGFLKLKLLIEYNWELPLNNWIWLKWLI